MKKKPASDEAIRRLLNDYAAALFDLDGTVADTEPLLHQAWIDLMAKHHRDISGFDYAKLIGKPDIEVARILLKHCRLRGDPKSLYWEYQKLIDAMVSKGASARPGADDTVRKFARLGLPLGVVTSARLAYARRVLRRLKMTRRFKVLVTADDPEVKRRKPHPDPYLRAAALMGVAPGKVVAFEDSPAGVASAKAAGMLVVAVPHAQSPKDKLGRADLIIEGFENFRLAMLLR